MVLKVSHEWLSPSETGIFLLSRVVVRFPMMHTCVLRVYQIVHEYTGSVRYILKHFFFHFSHHHTIHNILDHLCLRNKNMGIRSSGVSCWNGFVGWGLVSELFTSHPAPDSPTSFGRDIGKCFLRENGIRWLGVSAKIEASALGGVTSFTTKSVGLLGTAEHMESLVTGLSQDWLLVLVANIVLLVVGPSTPLPALDTDVLDTLG